MGRVLGFVLGISLVASGCAGCSSSHRSDGGSTRGDGGVIAEGRRVGSASWEQVLTLPNNTLRGWAALSDGETASLFWATHTGQTFAVQTLPVDATSTEGTAARAPEVVLTQDGEWTTMTFFLPRPRSDLHPVLYFLGLQPNRWPDRLAAWSPGAGLRIAASCYYPNTPVAGAFDGTNLWIAPKGQACTGACPANVLELRDLGMTGPAPDAGVPLCTGLPTDNNQFEISIAPGERRAVVSGYQKRTLFSFADASATPLLSVSDADLRNAIPDAGVVAFGAARVLPAADGMLVAAELGAGVCPDRSEILEIRRLPDGGARISQSALSTVMGQVDSVQPLAAGGVAVIGREPASGSCGERPVVALLSPDGGITQSLVNDVSGERLFVAEHHGDLVVFTSVLEIDGGTALRTIKARRIAPQ